VGAEALMEIRKPRPLFRRELRDGPAHPLGERVLVREFPIEGKTEGGLELADVAKERYFGGTLIAAGDQAADKLYDLGVEIGDEIWYGKYAGLVQEWQHIAGADNPKCPHDGSWDYVAKTDPRWKKIGIEPDDNVTLRACAACETLKVTERVIALAVDDLCLNVDLQARLESGEMQRERQETEDGRTRYVILRNGKRPDNFEIKKEKV
jgi:co-chaperonin GroES (HSP10)